MTRVFRELERVESRVLGALRCIDATTRSPVETPLQLTLPQGRLQRNRSGLYVIVQAPGLEAHEAEFDAPPPAPAVGSVALVAPVSDPGGRYLPRSVAFTLPRDPAPANAASPGSLFRAIDVPMFPASAAPVGGNWALLRVSVTTPGSGDAAFALGGVLLRVLQDGEPLARGLSDARGEALVAVPGVPVTTWSDMPGAVVVGEINVQLEATAETASVQRTPMADVAAGRAPASAAVDPDRLEAGGAGFVRVSMPLALAAGRSQTVSVALALPP